MNYDQRVKRLEDRRKVREAKEIPATLEEKKTAIGIVLFVVMFLALNLSDITTAEMIGYMIGFSIVMLPLTLFVGTLKILK